MCCIVCGRRAGRARKRCREHNITAPPPHTRAHNPLNTHVLRRAIAQGCSEYNITALIDQKDSGASRCTRCVRPLVPACPRLPARPPRRPRCIHTTPPLYPHPPAHPPPHPCTVEAVHAVHGRFYLPPPPPSSHPAPPLPSSTHPPTHSQGAACGARALLSRRPAHRGGAGGARPHRQHLPLAAAGAGGRAVCWWVGVLVCVCVDMSGARGVCGRGAAAPDAAGLRLTPPAPPPPPPPASSDRLLNRWSSCGRSAKWTCPPSSHPSPPIPPSSPPLLEQVEQLRQEYQVDVRVLGVASSRRMLLGEGALDLATWREEFEDKVGVWGEAACVLVGAHRALPPFPRQPLPPPRSVPRASPWTSRASQTTWPPITCPTP